MYRERFPLDILQCLKIISEQIHSFLHNVPYRLALSNGGSAVQAGGAAAVGGLRAALAAAVAHGRRRRQQQPPMRGSNLLLDDDDNDVCRIIRHINENTPPRSDSLIPAGLLKIVITIFYTLILLLVPISFQLWFFKCQNNKIYQ